MGNIVNNPNSKNNEFKRKTVFDKKIIDILKNVTTVNDTNIPNIPTFKDPISGKNIYYKHLTLNTTIVLFISRRSPYH